MAPYRAWSYWLKSLYRHEPLLTVALTAGSLDLVIGAAYGSLSLSALGLVAVGGGAGLLWGKAQRRASLRDSLKASLGAAAAPAAVLYLPDRAPPPLYLDQRPKPRPPS